MTKNEQPKDRQPRNAIRAIATGVLGWLTFQAFCGRSTLYSEYLLYGPAAEIALGQGWRRVRVQYALGSRSGKPGRRPTIDLVLIGCRTRVGVEIKWVGRTPTTKELRKDEAKLRQLEPLPGTKGSRVHSYLLLIGNWKKLRRIQRKVKTALGHRESLRMYRLRGIAEGPARPDYAAMVVEIRRHS